MDVHTHFGSATNALAVFLSVVLVGTLWRLVALHAMKSNNQTVAGLGRAASVQF